MGIQGIPSGHPGVGRRRHLRCGILADGRLSTASTSGFTLLEVMVAVAILGIAMTAVLYGQAQGIRAQGRIQNVSLATMKAREMLVHYLSAGRDEIPRAGESIEITLEPPYEFMNGTLAAEEDPNMPGLLVLTLTVSWQSGQQGREDTFSSTTGQGGGDRLEVCFYMASM